MFKNWIYHALVGVYIYVYIELQYILALQNPREQSLILLLI